jgi:hypothetical protein
VTLLGELEFLLLVGGVMGLAYDIYRWTPPGPDADLQNYPW